MTTTAKPLEKFSPIPVQMNVMALIMAYLWFFSGIELSIGAALLIPGLYVVMILFFIFFSARGSKENGRWIGLRLAVLAVLIAPMVVVALRMG